MRKLFSVLTVAAPMPLLAMDTVVAPIPEPSTMVMIGLGVAGLVALKKLRRK